MRDEDDTRKPGKRVAHPSGRALAFPPQDEVSRRCAPQDEESGNRPQPEEAASADISKGEAEAPGGDAVEHQDDDWCDFGTDPEYNPVFDDTPAGEPAVPSEPGPSIPDLSGIDPNGPGTVAEAWAAYRRLVERGPEDVAPYPSGGSVPQASSRAPARPPQVESSGTRPHAEETQRTVSKHEASPRRLGAKAAQRREKMAEVRRKDRPRDEARRAAPACANRPITRPLSEQRLTERQEAFCQFYVEGHSGTAAAKHAGYAPGSAQVTASRLLRAPKVAARIAALRRDLGVANEISPKVVLAKLERLYRAAAYNRSFTAAARILTLQAQFAGIAPNVRGSGGTQSPPQRASEPPRDEVSSKLGANKAANAPANGRAQEDAKVDAKHLAKADAKPTGGNATEDAADSCGGTASDTASDTAALDAPARPVPENLARRYSEKRQRAAARNRRR